MATPIGFLIPLLRQYLGTAARGHLNGRMQRAEPVIIKGMTEKGLAPPEASVAVCSRDALFRLWKAVVRSGDIADLIRDTQSRRVVPAVVAALPASADLAAIVSTTRDEALDALFGEDDT